jgi:nitrite reductase/ring-hydroxylating ferredoxin subunit
MEAKHDEPVRPGGWCADRRALLCGIGGLTAAGLLAACGNNNTAHAAGPSPATSSAASAAVLARTADVPVAGGTVVGAVLLVQPVAGTFKAYDAACPHKGVLLKAPADGVVKCPAHGSTFRAADGSLLGGPATRGLTEIAIAVDGADIVRS